MRRFVFVPLAGPNTTSDWLKFPHAKAWGFIDDIWDTTLTAIHVEGAAADCIPLGEPCSIFDAEIEHAVDVAEDSTDLPEPVVLALAKLALMPKELPDGN